MVAKGVGMGFVVLRRNERQELLYNRLHITHGIMGRRCQVFLCYCRELAKMHKDLPRIPQNGILLSKSVSRYLLITIPPTYLDLFLKSFNQARSDYV